MLWEQEGKPAFLAKFGVLKITNKWVAFGRSRWITQK